MQTTNTVLMVRPAAFYANPQTLHSNSFQKHIENSVDTTYQAQIAFDQYSEVLRQAGIHVVIIEDGLINETPDSIFPNNWLSTSNDASVFTYPMEALNRRRERRPEILNKLCHEFIVNKHIDLSPFEKQGFYFEGTGVLILEHDHQKAFVCRSTRSAELVGQEYSKLSGYELFWFNATDRNGKSIYHTNVMMSLGTRFAVVCLESIHDELERNQLINLLEVCGKTIIDVSYEQMENFSCNILELKNTNNEPVYAMSTRAWNAFNPEQQKLISDYAHLALAPIDVIEDLGGGGARCMLAEIFLQRHSDEESTWK
ncbi:arginine deiminase-related protein [Acinetobacter sp. ME22]|uniref:citrulline utilization hydrolase CtlX n=1 Tax=Acinetobacter sp. ME22 TaxID=2904802 RepID=UPI001EDA4EAB|nr:arginine deiminase-related protein [Acinetobacter sp. ME22]MCG2574954.1 arginine deiminase-related protein [Acinetobacter sp. ME22]